HPTTVIYVMKTRTDHGQAEKQMKELETFCEFKAYPVVHTAIDDSNSNRQELKQVLVGADERRFQLLLFYSVSQLGSICDISNYLNFLNDRRIGYRSHTEPWFDSGGPYRENSLAVIKSLAGLEQVVIKERISHSDNVKPKLKRGRKPLLNEK